MPGASRSDSERDFAVMLMGNVYHHFNGTHVREQLQVSFFLFLGHRQRVDRQPLLLAQGLENLARGNSPQGVKARFRKRNAMALGDRLPGSPMERHRISQSAVAIKNNPLNHGKSPESQSPRGPV